MGYVLNPMRSPFHCLECGVEWEGVNKCWICEEPGLYGLAKQTLEGKKETAQLSQLWPGTGSIAKLSEAPPGETFIL